MLLLPHSIGSRNNEKNEIVTDLLNSRMGNATLQDTLTVEVLTPEEAFKRATMFKHSEQTTSVFQKKKLIGCRSSFEYSKSNIQNKTGTD